MPCLQAFAHPQARFLYEKMWQRTLTRSSLVGRLSGGINYVSYAGIHCAMAMGMVSESNELTFDCCIESAAWHDTVLTFRL